MISDSRTAVSIKTAGKPVAVWRDNGPAFTLWKSIVISTVLGTSACARHAPPPSSELAYEIAATHSGKCLDVEGSSMESGAGVLQWDCHRQPNQLWKIVPQSGDTLRIVAQHSSQCLSIVGAGKSENIVQSECLPQGRNLGQTWKLKGMPDWSAQHDMGDRYQIVSASNGKCLNVGSSSKENGANIFLYDCGEKSPNEIWKLNPAPPSPSSKLSLK